MIFGDVLRITGLYNTFNSRALRLRVLLRCIVVTRRANRCSARVPLSNGTELLLCVPTPVTVLRLNGVFFQIVVILIGNRTKTFDGSETLGFV